MKKLLTLIILATTLNSYAFVQRGDQYVQVENRYFHNKAIGKVLLKNETVFTVDSFDEECEGITRPETLWKAPNTCQIKITMSKNDRCVSSKYENGVYILEGGGFFRSHYRITLEVYSNYCRLSVKEERYKVLRNTNVEVYNGASIFKEKFHIIH